MKVRDIMTTNVATCSPSDDLQKVARMMVECDCGAIPVIDTSDSNHPMGIVTDRDIVTRIIAKGKNPLQATAKDAMTPNIEMISPESDVEEAIRLMEQKQIRRLIVSDGNRMVQGMLAQADIARQNRDEKAGELVEQVSQPSRSASKPA